jgi:hypothetical protein
VFGFFSSDEHLSDALSFYVKIVEQASPEIAVVLLEPFFNSAATARFLEVALDDFFNVLLFECSLSPDRDALVAHHGAFLADCFGRAAPLLPEAHRSLLCTLRDRRFPRFRELVLQRFLWRATFLYLRSSACAREEGYMKAVIQSLDVQKQGLKRLFRALIESRTRFSLPKLFGSFDETFLCYYLCVNDICLLARMLDEARQLPTELSFADFLEVDAGFQYRSFWCQVFPHRGDLREDLGRRVVFPASLNGLRAPFGELVQLANSFEMLMEERRRAIEARNWKQLVSTHAGVLMAFAVSWAASHPEMTIPRRIRQRIVIAAIREEVTADPDVAMLAEHWDSLAGRERGDTLPPGISHRVWPGVRLGRAAAHAPLPDAFRLLLRAAGHFATIAECARGGDPMTCSLLKMLPGAALLVPFVILNATVAHEPGFMSDGERRLWVMLERCILSTLCVNEGLFHAVIAQQAALGRRMRGI